MADGNGNTPNLVEYFDTQSMPPLPLPSPPTPKQDRKGRITNPHYLKFLTTQEILIVKEQHILQAINNIDNGRKRAKRELANFVICLYYTGARPAEVLRLNRESFKRDKSELKIDLPTLKGGMARMVMLRMKHPLIKRLWKYVDGLPPYTPLFDRLRNTRIRKHVDRKGNLRLRTIESDIVNKHFRGLFAGTELDGIPPYYLRHSRFTAMSEKGASMEDIMISKGARDIASVRPYIHRSLEKARKLSKMID